MILSHRVRASFLLVLFLFHTFACSSTIPNQGTIPLATTYGDASVVATDVVLLGLPPNVMAGTTSGDAGTPPLVTTGGPNGEIIVPLRQREPAPFNGVLFNGPAIARVSVEFSGQQRMCLIDRRHDVDLLTARYTEDVQSLQLALATQARTDQILLNGRDADMVRLNRLLEQQTRASNPPHLGEGIVWAGAGFVLGVLIVGGIVIYANARP